MPKTTILVLALCALFSQSAFAADYRVHLQTVDQAKARRTGVLELTAVIEDLSGAGGVVPQLRLKPFLVPAAPLANGRANQKGVALAGQNYSLTFPATADGQRSAVTVTYSAPLPNVPADSYLLGAVVNSDQGVVETDRNNNISPVLLEAGSLHSIGPDPDDAPVDLHSDTTNLTASYGSASHGWRLFWRGEREENYELWAGFFILDIAGRRAYEGSYEKGVGWIDMGTDFDSRGRLVPYDVYGNAPTLANAPSGKLHLMTWVNFKETIPEIDSNNIDLEPFEAYRARLRTPSDGWIDIGPNSPRVQSKVVVMAHDFSMGDVEKPFEIDPASIPAGMTVSPMSGSILAPQLTITVDVTGWEAAMHRFTLGVRVEQERLPLEFFVNVREHLSSTPAILPLPPATVRKSEFQSGGFLTITNVGMSPMLLAVSPVNESLVLSVRGTQVIQAYETLTIPVGIETRTLQVGDNTPGLAVSLASGSDAPQTFILESRVRVTAP